MNPSVSGSPAPLAVDAKTFEPLTLRDLLRRLTVGAWFTILGTSGSIYSAGVASSNWGLMQSLFARPSSLHIQDFSSRAVLEKSMYIIESGPDRLVVFVKDVSVARKVLELEVGLEGGTREFVRVQPNVAKDVAIGARVYEIVVHDLALSTFGQDIAVVSFKPARV